MNEYVAKGSNVTDIHGKKICETKVALVRHTIAKAGDFHNFVEGEEPFVAGAVMDRRCFRDGKHGGIEVCIDGEWR